jgi:hypothetical protein
MSRAPLNSAFSRPQAVEMQKANRVPSPWSVRARLPAAAARVDVGDSALDSARSLRSAPDSALDSARSVTSVRSEPDSMLRQQVVYASPYRVSAAAPVHDAQLASSPRAQSSLGRSPSSRISPPREELSYQVPASDRAEFENDRLEVDLEGEALQERTGKQKPKRSSSVTRSEQVEAQDHRNSINSTKEIAAERSPSTVVTITDDDRLARATDRAEDKILALEFLKELATPPKPKKEKSTVLTKDEFRVKIAETLDHSQSLRNDFSVFHLSAPIKSPDFPQALSSMGFPFVPGIHNSAQAKFQVKENGWGGDVSNPDVPSSREARIHHVLESTIRDTKTLDLTSFATGGHQEPLSPVAAIPDIESMIRSDEKIVAFLNCAEVHGAPNSSSVFSKGFVQAAIVERKPSGSKRLIIYSLSGNLSCVLNEQVDQEYADTVITETKCCCCHKQQGNDMRRGSLAYEYSVTSQSLGEISMINIENAVVNVQVTKKKIDSLHAMANPKGNESFLQFGPPKKKKCCNCDCKKCWREMCMAILRCIIACLIGCYSCWLWLLKCLRCSKVVAQTSGGSRRVEYSNVIGRDLGYTSLLNVGGVSSPHIYARDTENGVVTACEREGSAHIVTLKNDMSGVPWKIEEMRDERVVIEIKYRSALTNEIGTCHLVMNKATDTSRSEFVGDLAKYAQTDTANLALAGKFANELLPMKTEAAKTDDKKKAADK